MKLKKIYIYPFDVNTDKPNKEACIVLESKSELTKDKVLKFLTEEWFYIFVNEINTWWEDLNDGIIVYQPNSFRCAMEPVLDVKNDNR